nr:MAG TPA: hypothetical protein [Caudoviricetes sp.]
MSKVNMFFRLSELTLNFSAKNVVFSEQIC